MAAVFTFLGFSPAGELHVLVAGIGPPAEAACLLLEARALDPRPRGLPQALLRCRPGLLPVGPRAWHGSVGHRYRIRLLAGARQSLRLDGWRRYGDSIGWQRRCGPLSLEQFLNHFLPPELGRADRGAPSTGDLLRDADMEAECSQASAPLHNLWPPSRPVFCAEDCYVRHRFPYRQRPR